jgi:ABC-2 type transport system permease protein
VRRALSSELLKLRTTRTFFALVLSAVLLVGAISVLGAALGTFDAARRVPPGEDLVGITFFGPLFALVLGVLAVSTEFRHGTITPTLLAVPSRRKVVVAKVVAHVLAGFALGLAAMVLNLLLVAAIFSARGIESGTTMGEALQWSAGVSLSAGLLAALGVAVGAIVRNQVGALVGALAWIFIVEPLLAIIPGLDSVLERFAVGSLIDGMNGFDDGSSGNVLAQTPAGLVLAGYVALLALVGVVLLRRRDVTA